MNKTADIALELSLYRKNETSVTHCDDALLQIFLSALGFYHLVKGLSYASQLRTCVVRKFCVIYDSRFKPLLQILVWIEHFKEI